MENADLCFERSQVEATVVGEVLSIKNPWEGFVCADSGKVIFDDPDAKGLVVAPSLSDGEKARAILAGGAYTCVLCRGADIRTTHLRGVKPLVQWLEAGDFAGFHAADKVVGKATAYLYRLLEVASVHAQVMSESARQVLEEARIPNSCGKLVPNIINRRGDGICPFEAAVLDIEDPQKAKVAIYQKMEEMGIAI